MGTPATSALRADTATNNAALNGAGGDPYGSLTGLGGPRKFKKKPVLVLDPEELERAHMMFQEASAELLGEEVERAPKPAVTMLGLAPMDDEDASPEDMGQSDDDQDGGDDEAIPTAEELLQMTTSSRAMEEDEEEQAYAMRALEEGFDEEHRIFPTLPIKPEEEIAAEEAGELTGPAAIEPAFDEPAEAPLEAELPEAEQVAEPFQSEPEAPAAEDRFFKLSPLTAGDMDEEDEEDDLGPSVNFAQLMPQIRRETPIRPPEEIEAAAEPAPQPEPEPAPEPEPEQELELEPKPDPEPVAEIPPIEASFWDEELAPLPEEAAPLPGQGFEASIEPEITYEAAPRFEDAPEDLPLSRHISPFEMQRAAKPVVPEAPAVEAEEPVPGFSAGVLPPEQPSPDLHDDWPPLDAAPVEEPEPAAAAHDHVADDERDWEPESYEAPEQVAVEDEWLPEPELEPEAAYAEDDYAEDDYEEPIEDDAGNYSVVEDEPVDGYAFMYAENPRGRALRSVAPGEANSLRARLVREREELQAETARKRSGGSIIARLANWVRGLFG